MESVRDEQYAALKFCIFLLQIFALKYNILQQAYGEDVLPKPTVF